MLWNRFAVVTLSCAALIAGGTSLAQDEGVVVEDEGIVEQAVVVDEDGIAVADDESSSGGGWSALPVAARELDGQRVFMRQSSDAFADPDQRMSLEPKYYFVLEESDVPAADSSRRGPPIDDSVVSAIGSAAGARSSVHWLDYNATKPELVAVLTFAHDAPVATLHVGKLDAGTLSAPKSRELTGEVVDCPAPLATWDISPAWKSKSALLSRVIAVLKCVDDRYCVDFFGASLHPDADCRVWLTPRDHEFGAPQGVSFIDLPIVKEEQQAQPISVCAVQFANRAIAFDFPLCRPALMEQMQRMAANRPAGAGQQSSGPDLTRLVGADLLDEFARRLVNGTYR